MWSRCLQYIRLGFSYAMMILVVRSLIAALLSGNITMLFFSLAAGAASIVRCGRSKNA